MNKAAIYTTLLFILILTLIFLGLYTNRNIASWKGDGVQFTVLRNVDFIFKGRKNDVFIFPNKKNKETKVYKKIESYGTSFKVHTAKFGHKTTSQLFMEAINEELVFQDTLFNIGSEQLIQQLGNGENFMGARLESSEDSEGLFGFIDDSVFVFLLAAFVLLFLLFIHDGIIFIVKKYTGKNIRKVIFWCSLISYILFFIYPIIMLQLAENSNPNMNKFWKNSIPTFLIQPLIIILIYTSFQYLQKKVLQKKDFVDQEMIKFLTLFLGTSFITISISVIFKMRFQYLHPDQLLLDSFNGTRLFIGFAFSFALANLLNNLIQYFIKLRIDKNEKQLHK